MQGVDCKIVTVFFFFFLPLFCELAFFNTLMLRFCVAVWEQVQCKGRKTAMRWQNLDWHSVPFVCLWTRAVFLFHVSIEHKVSGFPATLLFFASLSLERDTASAPTYYHLKFHLECFSNYLNDFAVPNKASQGWIKWCQDVRRLLREEYKPETRPQGRWSCSWFVFIVCFFFPTSSQC